MKYFFNSKRLFLNFKKLFFLHDFSEFSLNVFVFIVQVFHPYILTKIYKFLENKKSDFT